MDPNIVLFVSFILFLAFAFRYGYKKSLSTLDGQIEEIRQKLENAANEKREALALLAEQRQIYSDTLNLAESLESEAQEKLVSLKKTLMAELEQLVRRRESDLQELIQRLNKEALLDIQREISEVIHSVVLRYVETAWRDKEHQRLNEASIDEIISVLRSTNGDIPNGSETDSQLKKKPDLGIVS